MISAPLNTGNAKTTMNDISHRFQVRIGIRNNVIPGARISATVVITLTAVSVPDVPVRITDTIHRSAPSPGDPCGPDSGGYANQPKSAAPPALTNPSSMMRPPNRYSQYDSALSRGNAMSGAPI